MSTLSNEFYRTLRISMRTQSLERTSQVAIKIIRDPTSLSEICIRLRPNFRQLRLGVTGLFSYANLSHGRVGVLWILAAQQPSSLQWPPHMRDL